LARIWAERLMFEQIQIDPVDNRTFRLDEVGNFQREIIY
jgi:hypothetical protein